MTTLHTANLVDQGWREFKSEEDLLRHYPKHIWGTYRPQPWSLPDSYPCLWKEMATISNSDGPDHAMLVFIYDYQEDELEL